MDIRTLISQELLFFGEPIELADRILGCKTIRSHAPMVSWAIAQMVKRRYRQRSELAELIHDLGFKKSSLYHILYDIHPKKVVEIRALPEYAAVISEVTTYVGGGVALWESIMAYAYKVPHELALISMLERGIDPRDVACVLHTAYEKPYRLKLKYGIKSNK